MRINNISTIDNKIKYPIKFKSDNEPFNNKPLGDIVVTPSDYYDKKIALEQKKLDMIKRLGIAVGCFSTSGLIALGTIAITLFASKTAPKSSTKKLVDTPFLEFLNLSSSKHIPTLDTCKSMDKELEDLLRTQCSFYSASDELIKKSGAKPIKYIILNGPPGIGKSFFGKIMAKTIGADYAEVKIPNIVSKWAGEGVENIGKLSSCISEHASKNPNGKTVIVLNEIDAYIQPVERYSNSSGSTHWVSKMEERGALLDMIDMLHEKHPNVILIGTTNMSPTEGLDAASRSRFYKFEVKFPNENALYESLKMEFEELSYGETLLKTKETELRELALNMKEKGYSFRDKEKIVEVANRKYLDDLKNNIDKEFEFDYLTDAFKNYNLTDGKAKSAAA